MIESIKLANFKRHAQTTLALRPFTILVGPNGAGKTSVLEALHALAQLEGTVGEDLFDGPLAPAAIVRRQPNVTTLALGVYGSNSRGPIELRLIMEAAHPGAQLHPILWEGKVAMQGVGVKFGPLVLTNKSLRDQGYAGRWPELHRCVFMRVDPHSVCAPSLAFADATIATDGGMLPTVLANLKLSDDGAFERLLTELRRLVPEIRGLRPLPMTIETSAGPRAGYGLVFDTDSGTGIRGTDMSEGTLVLLALLTVIYSPARPRLLLLDGLETALHPTAQMKFTKRNRSRGVGSAASEDACR